MANFDLGFVIHAPETGGTKERTFLVIGSEKRGRQDLARRK